MIQEQLSTIVKRFKENDYIQHSSNKENECRQTGREQSASKQQILMLRKCNRRLEEAVDRMVVDGNKMHRFYEEIIMDMTMQFQAMKEEYNGYRRSTSEERKEEENLVEFLNKKIETLHHQIANKEDMYRQLLEKYEELQEKVVEVHLEDSEHLKKIENEFVRESMHHQEQKKLSSLEIQEMRQQLKETLDANQELLNENECLKNMNESLAHNIEYLKNKLYIEKNIIHQDQQEEQHREYSELQRCDVQSISREEDRYTLEEMKMNDSQEINFNGEKEVLNLSQHYSKFNRTVQFMSKEKESYEFVVTESNERKSFAKKREGATNNQNVLVRIGAMSSQKEIEEAKRSTSRLITEVKEFKMQEPSPSESSIVDPYRAFFILLTQCEKMNSPEFDKISHIDLSYLYPELLRTYVPYNLWQAEIKKVLKEKLQKR